MTNNFVAWHASLTNSVIYMREVDLLCQFKRTPIDIHRKMVQVHQLYGTRVLIQERNVACQCFFIFFFLSLSLFFMGSECLITFTPAFRITDDKLWKWLAQTSIVYHAVLFFFYISIRNVMLDYPHVIDMIHLKFNNNSWNAFLKIHYHFTFSYAYFLSIMPSLQNTDIYTFFLSLSIYIYTHIQDN